MKTKYLLIIIVLAVAVGVLMSTLKNTAANNTFQAASLETEKEFRITGELVKSKPIVYDPMVNPDKFEFFMKDEQNTIQRVVCSKGKPYDFEKTDQITIVGKHQGDHFYAEEILLKCPSKYEEDITNI